MLYLLHCLNEELQTVQSIISEMVYSMGSKKIVIISSDIIGENMAGPGIRYFQFASFLAERFEVTLIAPSEVSPQNYPFRLVHSARAESLSTIKNADLVLTQGFNFPLRSLLKTDAVLIIDLYDPVPFEMLGMVSFRDWDRELDLLYDWTIRKTNLLLQRGDYFLCATERQKALWTGMLLGLGRINARTIKSDPHLDTLFTLLPFGIENREFPTIAKNNIRLTLDGVTDDDFLFYWGGGIWDWLDPFILIEALKKLENECPHMKAVFLAGKHPNPDIPDMSSHKRSYALAKEFGLLNRSVFFINKWIPYEERTDYLLGVNCGCTFHQKSVEATYSFRTRMLDYLWAGLPIICSEGDELASEIEMAGAGITVPTNDVSALVRAMKVMVESPARLHEMAVNAEKLAEKYRWKRLLEGLNILIEHALAGPRNATGYAPVKTSNFSLTAFYARNLYEEMRYLGYKKGLQKIFGRFLP